MREVLRAEACAATGAGKTAVGEYIRRAEVIGITWPVLERIDDAELERRLFPVAGDGTAAQRRPINWPRLHEELKRRSVTLVLLWQEYRADEPGGYGYSRFHDPSPRPILESQHRRARRVLDLEPELGPAAAVWEIAALGQRFCWTEKRQCEILSLSRAIEKNYCATSEGSSRGVNLAGISPA